MLQRIEQQPRQHVAVADLAALERFIGGGQLARGVQRGAQALFHPAGFQLGLQFRFAHALRARLADMLKRAIADDQGKAQQRQQSDRQGDFQGNAEAAAALTWWGSSPG